MIELEREKNWSEWRRMRWLKRRRDGRRSSHVVGRFCGRTKKGFEDGRKKWLKKESVLSLQW